MTQLDPKLPWPPPESTSAAAKPPSASASSRLHQPPVVQVHRFIQDKRPPFPGRWRHIPNERRSQGDPVPKLQGCLVSSWKWQRWQIRAVAAWCGSLTPKAGRSLRHTWEINSTLWSPEPLSIEVELIGSFEARCTPEFNAEPIDVGSPPYTAPAWSPEFTPVAAAPTKVELIKVPFCRAPHWSPSPAWAAPRFRCDELELPTIIEGPKPGGGEAEVPGHRCRDLQLPTTILSAGSCMVGPHFTILTSQLFRLVEVFVRSRTNRKRSSWISFLGDTLPSAPRGPSARACTGLARRDAAAGVCIVPQPWRRSPGPAQGQNCQGLAQGQQC